MAENTKRVQSPYPPVMKLQLEVTLEQAHIIFLALKHYRTSLQFNVTALMATEDEQRDAARDVMIIDRLKGMFE